MKREKYLESLLPCDEEKLVSKYWGGFEKYCSYKGCGTYEWLGIWATDTRELWLMGVLYKEGIEFEND